MTYPRDLQMALERVGDTARKYADSEVDALRAALSIALGYLNAPVGFYQNALDVDDEPPSDATDSVGVGTGASWNYGLSIQLGSHDGLVIR